MVVVMVETRLLMSLSLEVMERWETFQPLPVEDPGRCGVARRPAKADPTFFLTPRLEDLVAAADAPAPHNPAARP